VQELVKLRIELGKIGDEIDALRAQIADAAQRSAELRESIRAIEKTPRTAALDPRLRGGAEQPRTLRAGRERRARLTVAGIRLYLH
jgi:predicted  nucleic acid-binding Zn-ribbon protein